MANQRTHTSRTVTLIAVTLLVLSGLAALLASLPTALFTRRLWRDGHSLIAIMQAASFLFRVLVAVLAVGLLKRRNWARVGLIGVMSLVIFWELAQLTLKLVEGVPIAPRTPLAMLSSAILALLIVSTWQLLKPSVRAEFLS